MSLGDRLTYALLSALFGLLLGVLCWWLYGLAHSLNYDGPGLDPMLRHWLVWTGVGFGVFGFVLGAQSADVVGDVLSGILHFEFNDTPGRGAGTWVGVVYMALVLVTIWFTTPLPLHPSG